MGGVLVIMPRGCQKTNETVNDTATRQVPDKYPTSTRQVPGKLRGKQRTLTRYRHPYIFY